MAIRKASENGSTHAGAQVGEDARRDLLSLSLAPVRQGLRFYAEINRSILETFFRFIPWGMSPFGALSERHGLPATKPGATKRPTAKPSGSKRAAATKRPATTKAVTTKRPATTKAPATKRPAASKGVANRRPAAPPTPRQATGQKAAPKRAGKAAPKPTVKGAGRVKPAAAKKAASRSRNARAGAGKKA